MSDVLRLALPPRRGPAEKRAVADPGRAARRRRTRPASRATRPGRRCSTALAEGRPARAVWTALPGEDWPTRLAELCQAALSGRPRCAGRRPRRQGPRPPGRGRRGAVLPAALVHRAARRRHPGDALPRFLAASRGAAQVVLGTRGGDVRAGRATSAWWSSGTTATTCTPTTTRPIRTPATCWSSAPTWTTARPSSPGTARTAEAALLVESRLGARAGRRPDGAARGGAAGAGARRRLRAGPRPGRPLRPAAVAGARGGPPGARRRARRCSCRCRGGATSPRCRARGAGRRPAARTAPGPLGISPRPGPGRHPDPGLPVVRPPGGHLRLPALPRHQAPGRGGGGVPDRGGAGAGVPRRGGPHVRQHHRRAGHGRRRARRSSSRPRAPSRSPRAGTAPRCCSTRGRCSAGPTCGRARRRCAGG